MKKIIFILSLVAIAATLSAANLPQGKTTISKTHIKFFSHTVAEDIEANNYASVATIDIPSGEVVFSVPMQSFEFKIALMQKHFNSPAFLDSKQFPKAKLTGKITNLAQVNFAKDGTYNVTIEGELTIKGVTKPITQKGTITVTGKKIEGVSKFNITLSDYGITFLKGKPASNIAKTVEVTVNTEYLTE
ncbi:MAG: YceI family protein [Paludibacter sp.]|nr:YceI family protein [Paludibacter sp.]